MKNKIDILLSGAIISLGIALTGCGGASGDAEYISVQLDDSKMWSLLDVNKGEMVFTDEFFAPVTSVEKGAFFMQTDEGSFDLYRLSDTKNKLNRDSYTFVTNFNKHGYAIVRVKSEPWQIIDTKGSTIATLDKNANISSGFSDDGLAVFVNKDGLCGFVNEQGQITITPKFKAVRPFCDGVAVVLSKNEGGKAYFDVIDTRGETLFKFNTGQYSDISDYHQNHAFAVEGDHIVLLDKQGQKVAAVGSGSSISDLSYSDGKFIYSDGEFYGVKDLEGNILLRAKYNKLQFVGGSKLLARSSNGKYGVVNPADDVVMPFEYNQLTYVAPGRYLTYSGSLQVLINEKGKEICKYAFKNVVNRSETAMQGTQTNIISSQNNNAQDYSTGFESLTSLIEESYDGYGYDMSRYGYVDIEEVDEPGISGETMTFEGTVGEYPVELSLSFGPNGRVTGLYKYLKTGNGDVMILEGTYVLSNSYEANVSLIEKYKDNVSATWTLNVVNGGDPIARGTMVTSAGKTFQVNMELKI